MTEYEGFPLIEAETIVGIYVCAQCEGELTFVENFSAQNDTYIVICPDCGNVEQVGRITKTTVAIRNERGIFDFPKIIRTLPDLWGELIPTQEQRKQMIKDLGY